MAFDHRLIVFDLDGTLVLATHNRLEEACVPAHLIDLPLPYYIYVRPEAANVLAQCILDDKNVIVLFSAGEALYVHTVVQMVLYPIIRRIDKEFSFDIILTKDDLDAGGDKNVAKLCNDLCIDRSKALLIDDALENCVNCGCYYFNIPSFDPRVLARDFDDCDLTDIFLHEIFD